jgi:hypothetical protein
VRSYRSNIFGECDAIVDWLDMHDINADDGGGAGHLLGAHLHPATGGSTKVNYGLCILQELVHETKMLKKIHLRKRQQASTCDSAG